MRHGFRAVVIVAVTLGLAGVVGVASAGAAAQKTKVVLSEWIVKPKPRSVGAGKVTFVAQNLGGETHELVVLRGGDPADLPTDADGAVIEEEVEDRIVGEIEDVASGKKKTTTLRLKRGSYVLFCNIVDTEDGEVESHFANGMVSTLTVR